jgi:hypothetical protein
MTRARKKNRRHKLPTIRPIPVSVRMPSERDSDAWFMVLWMCEADREDGRYEWEVIVGRFDEPPIFLETYPATHWLPFHSFRPTPPQRKKKVPTA